MKMLNKTNFYYYYKWPYHTFMMGLNENKNVGQIENLYLRIKNVVN